MGSQGILPTLPNAWCQTTTDALMIFEAVLQGRITAVQRRPHDRERTDIVQSGNIFIFNEQESGIKRWTDGVPWSPSRILGNFLIYRELSQPFPPGEKKRAQKRITASAPQNDPNHPGDFDRALVGSLVDSYNFKTNGLVKKTISVLTETNRQYHMISYYNPQDVVDGKLQRPTNIETLQGCFPRMALQQQQNFRVNNEHQDRLSTTTADSHYSDQYNVPKSEYPHPVRQYGSDSGDYLQSGFNHGSLASQYNTQGGSNVPIPNHYAKDSNSQPSFGNQSESQPRYRPFVGDFAVTSGGMHGQIPALANATGEEGYANHPWTQSAVPSLTSSAMPNAGLTAPHYSESVNYSQGPARPSPAAYNTSGGAHWSQTTSSFPNNGPLDRARMPYGTENYAHWQQSMGTSASVKTQDETDGRGQALGHWHRN